MDGTVEARPEWKDLLDRVRRGETLTLTEGGRVVARLEPSADRHVRQGSPKAEDLQQLIARFEAFAAEHSLGRFTWKDLRDEGRKY
jgi:antitoxin (DNA-binding transcriptional repressor) of toxin-antitoxin stability system